MTAATLRKEHHFRSEERLALLQESLLRLAEASGWQLQAWAVFSNHYHFVGRACGNARTLKQLVQAVHSDTAIKINHPDSTPGRQVWHQYWDHCLTFERSYYARLNYVLQNAVRHGLVRRAQQYPYCSAVLAETRWPCSFRRMIYSFACDRINEKDDFNPHWSPAIPILE